MRHTQILNHLQILSKTFFEQPKYIGNIFNLRESSSKIVCLNIDNNKTKLNCLNSYTINNNKNIVSIKSHLDITGQFNNDFIKIEEFFGFMDYRDGHLEIDYMLKIYDCKNTNNYLIKNLKDETSLYTKVNSGSKINNNLWLNMSKFNQDKLNKINKIIIDNKKFMIVL
jgi:hypothetical protein